MMCIITLVVVTIFYILSTISNFKAGEKFLGWYGIAASIACFILFIESIIWYLKFDIV